MKWLLPFFFFSSCSLFKTFDVSENMRLSAKKICLSGEGKGRLGVNNKKYIFQYESGLDLEYANWKLALNFPLQKSELFELDWSENGKVKFSSSIDQRILRENDAIDPHSFDFFTRSIGQLIQEIISLKEATTRGGTRESKFQWKQSKKILSVTNSKENFTANFSNMVGDEYFGLIKMSYIDSKKQNFRMDLIVKTCFH